MERAIELARGAAGRVSPNPPVGAEEIASVVAFLCSEQAGCITGEAISASGGSTKAVFY